MDGELLSTLHPLLFTDNMRLCQGILCFAQDDEWWEQVTTQGAEMFGRAIEALPELTAQCRC